MRWFRWRAWLSFGVLSLTLLNQAGAQELAPYAGVTRPATGLRSPTVIPTATVQPTAQVITQPGRVVQEPVRLPNAPVPVMAPASPTLSLAPTTSPAPMPTQPTILPPTEHSMPVAVPLEAKHEEHPHEVHLEEGHEEHALKFTFFAEYLLLKPRRAAHDIVVSSPNFNLIPGGPVGYMDWETRSAYRLGTSVALGQTGLMANLTYTYLHSNDDVIFGAPQGGTLYATTTRGLGIDDVNSALGQSNLNYNVFDLDVSKVYHGGEGCDLKVFGGGRFASIEQQFNVIYNGGTIPANNARVYSPSYFRGAGLTVGGEALWTLYRGLGVYTRARGSLVSGEFRNFLQESNNNGQTGIVNVSDKYYKVVPVAEVAMGLSLEYESITLRVGYELANWFNFIDSPDFPGPNFGKLGRRMGDLTIEGLAFQLAYRY